MSQTLCTRDVKLGNWIINVTTRDAGEDTQLLEELTYRTIIMWVNIVRRLEKNNYTYEGESVEKTYATEINKRMMADTDAPKPEPFEFVEPWGSSNSRVTVWSTYRGAENPNFHLNSDDKPQTAIDVWVANEKGITRAAEKLAALIPQSHQEAEPQVTPPNQATDKPATPKNAPNANVGSFYTKNEAIEKLAVGTVFNMKICQIKLRSKDDQRYYELYAKYGQNVGKYPEISLYTDNEVAVKNGLIADLDTFGLKPGESKLGEWILSCNVGKPKVDGDKTYGRVYADSFVK